MQLELPFEEHFHGCYYRFLYGAGELYADIWAEDDADAWRRLRLSLETLKPGRAHFMIEENDWRYIVFGIYGERMWEGNWTLQKKTPASSRYQDVHHAYDPDADNQVTCNI